jgi:hypothetical protein
MNKTLQRKRWRNALLVAIEDRLASRCTVVLRALDLEVVEAAGPRDGGERIVTIQPAIVVAPARKRAEWCEAIEERTLAVGAELVWIDDNVDASKLIDVLTKAATAVIERASRG